MSRLIGLIIFLILALASHGAWGKIRLPKLISDSMVIQRDARIKIWGWADRQERVKVSFRGKNYTTTTGDDGTWTLWLSPSPAGGPFTMRIEGKDNVITIQNILVGDVWLCSGQSNMVHYLDLHKDRYQNEINAAHFPEIRQFLVPTRSQLSASAEDIDNGNWKAANPKNVLRFSVVAYFFAQKIYEKYKVPIGLINASVGGTPIEAWTSEAGLSEFPDVLNRVQKNKDTAYVNKVNRLALALRNEIEKRKDGDAGLESSRPWYDTLYAASDWSAINIPGYWEDQGVKDLNGVVWYRREIDVPRSMLGMPAKIAMGRVVDADFFYINGKLIGNTGYQYPQRRYSIPAGVLKPGKNVFTIRVINSGGKGGFVHDKPYYLATETDTLDLKGYWQYKVGEVFKPVTGSTGGISIQNQPAALFNAMIAPVTSFALKGVLWYQGESNTSNAQEYERLLPALIHDWRKQWKQSDLPFLYAQLPNFLDVNYLPAESEWAVLREAQRKALNLPNTAMAVTIDLGEWNDIHPGNKKPIGERLALAAQKVAYHENDVVHSGPVFTAITREENKLVAQFSNVGSGLISKDGDKLRWFAIAGADKKFLWADTKIAGDRVEIWNEDVVDPVYVRYAWADNPDGVNFYNKEGLPASPFEAQVEIETKLWHGKKAAVVLTYDDALDVHIDHVMPALNVFGLKGTFYLSGSFPGSKNRMQDWKRAAQAGHELANHTFFHPCDASKPGRAWVSEQNDLHRYTTAQIIREIEMTNIFLESLDGKKERTFAYTCGDTETGEGSFIDAIKKYFIAMRGVKGDINRLETLNLSNLNCYVVDNGNADQLISWAEKAKQENAWLVVLFHGVGGGHSINIDLKKHNNFLKFLHDHPEDYWVTTMIEASKHSIGQIKTGK